MKNIISFLTIGLFIAFFSCQSNKKIAEQNPLKLTSDTIVIANQEIEYEVIIIDAGFQSWFNSFARPKNYYSQSYLEARNQFWVMEWNNRVRNPMLYNPNLYEMAIDYNNSTNYGYDVNYMIYNYMVYFQLTNKQNLGGGFTARI